MLSLVSLQAQTGNLHLGHAFSALFAEREARTSNGKFLVRIEDIDTARCNSAFEASIFEDLSWLRLTWEKPVRKQSNHMADYAKGLKNLKTLAFCIVVLYPEKNFLK